MGGHDALPDQECTALRSIGMAIAQAKGKLRGN